LADNSDLEKCLLLADKFKEEIGTVSWSWLRPHQKRKILFQVAEKLDLVEVAIAVAEDRTAQVKSWLENDDLAQPTLKQVAKWEKSGGLFLGVIVKPYVFFKETVRHQEKEN
jgi:hypothetical protein